MHTVQNISLILPLTLLKVNFVFPFWNIWINFYINSRSSIAFVTSRILSAWVSDPIHELCTYEHLEKTMFIIRFFVYLYKILQEWHFDQSDIHLFQNRCPKNTNEKKWCFEIVFKIITILSWTYLYAVVVEPK